MPKRLIFLLILGGVFSGQTLVWANLTVVDRYIDDFSTEMARMDSVDANLFWIDKAYPPKSAYLVYTELNGDPVLAFRGYETEPARLEYCFPVNPGLVVRETSWIIEVLVDVKLSTSRDPANPVSGYLAYQVSADGVNWSAPTALRGENILPSGLLEQNRYLVFIGNNALLNRLEVTIYQPEATLRVGPGQINTIQDAVKLAQDGDRIIVDDGTYSGPGNTNIDFDGKDIVLMSANGPENCIIECAPGERGVLFTKGETEEAILDGFTILDGQTAMGAGIYCEGASPTISNCIIEECFSQDVNESAKGGGIYIESGKPTIKHCVFIDNQADGSSAEGGAVYIGSDAAAVITKCQFIHNTAQEGGAVFVNSSDALTESVIMQNCIFNGNLSEGSGGGLSLHRGLSEIVNCTFSNNQAGNEGGAVYIDHAQPNTTILNSILWQNQPDDIMASQTVSAAELEVRYNNITKNEFGNENISLDPGFADADNGDFHLRSSAGRWSLLDEQWVFDQETSPCIDMGNPTDAFKAERYPHGERINMGAYGGTAQASLGRGIRVIHVDIAYGSDLNNGLDSTHALASINTAVDLAQDGDYILVWPGVYQEDVVFQENKAITIQSAADAAIVTSPEGYAFSFNNGQTLNSVLRNMILADCGMGGIYIQASSPTIRNLTVVNNRLGIEAIENTDPDIKNCIFWNNWDGDVVSTTGVTVHYSVLSSDENDEGKGNLYQNPLFADTVNGDYHLSSQYGRYWPEHGVWIVDSVTSPCLDVGEPGIYPVEEPHYNGGRLNIGAHGGTGYASISAPKKSADLNNDGLVDFLDFALFAEAWLSP